MDIISNCCYVFALCFHFGQVFTEWLIVNIRDIFLEGGWGLNIVFSLLFRLLLGVYTEALL